MDRIHLLDCNDTILLLSPYRWQRFDALTKLGATSLPMMCKSLADEIGAILYANLVVLKRKGVVEEQI